MPATGRLAIGFDDQRYNAQTFWADGTTIVYSATAPGGSVSVGLAVTFAAGTDVVGLCADGDAVVGKLLKVEADGACTIQNKGNCTLPAGNAATITPGLKAVGALGTAAAKGYIRNVNSATAAELAKMGPFIWDNVTMTAVVVDLGG